jgi:hypothetical protein
MANEDSAEAILERVIAGRLLLLAARCSSESMDSFSGWMLAGFGGAFALVLANVQSVSALVRPGSLKWGSFWFLAAVLLGVMQKALASIVASSAAAGLEGEAIGREIANNNLEFDMRHVFHEMQEAVLPPFRWVVRRSFLRSAAGDHAAGGRLCMLLAQLQGWVVFCEAVLAILAVVILLRGLTV